MKPLHLPHIVALPFLLFEGGAVPPAPPEADPADRAKVLLLANLTLEQRRQWINYAYFIVKGSAGGTYAITTKEAYGVLKLDSDGYVIQRHCAYPSGSMPWFDRMLGQKLLIESDERAFRRIAYDQSPGTHYRDQRYF